MEIDPEQSHELTRLELQFLGLFLPEMNGILRWFERLNLVVINKRSEFYERPYVVRSDWSIRERTYSRLDGGDEVVYNFLLEMVWGDIETKVTKPERYEFGVSISTNPTEDHPLTVMVNTTYSVDGPFFNRDSIDGIVEFVIFDMGLPE